MPTFPNATYLFSQTGFDYWNPEGDEPPGGMSQAPIFADSVLPVVHAGQVQFFDGKHVIDEHLTIEPAPGHTPGNSVVQLRSGSELAFFGGDVLHTPMQFIHPDQGACLDEDPAAANKSRERILAQAAELHAPFFCHFPSGRPALIARKGGSYEVDRWLQFD